MFTRIVALVAALLLFATVHAQSPFPDVPERHWAEDAVVRLADLGILVGFPDGTFQGNNTVTRYEAAVVIYRLLSVVREESAAADAAIANQVATLRAVVMALADEIEELQRRAGANREAVDLLWDEVRALRQELDLPPPAPLPVYPPDAPEDEAPASGVRPDGVDAEDFDDVAPAPVTRSDNVDPQAPDDADSGPMADDRATEDDPARLRPEVGDAGQFSGVRQPTQVYASLAGGGTAALHWLARATIGVDNLVADGFGARLSLDLGRQSATPLASATLLGHVTYRFAEPNPVGGYAGAGLGWHLGGHGALASMLVGGTWSVFEPIMLFVEATLDVYFAPPVSAGGRIGSTVALGARWTF